MLVSEKLHQFYIQNDLSLDGGENEDYFYLTFSLFSIKLPNSDFRKKVVYIHDIQHILYDKDITWKGEAFIAGWEIATGIWKKLPIGFMSLWAMGFSLLIHSKEVLKGYKEGLLVKGIIDLDIPKEEILNYDITFLRSKIKKEKPEKFNKLRYFFWISVCQLIFWFPLLVLIAVTLYFIEP